MAWAFRGSLIYKKHRFATLRTGGTMKIKICLLAFCAIALLSPAAQAWGPRRPGFYFGFYGPPLYGPPVYGPPIYGPPIYGPPVYPPPVYAPPVVVAPPAPGVVVAPAPAPAYYYPRPAVGAAVWFR
jgi:hypothetical protein